MSIKPIDRMDESVKITINILSTLFSDERSRQTVSFRLWDGTCWPDEKPRPSTLVLRHPGALRQMLLPGSELALGEAYIYDDFNVEGDLEGVFQIAGNLRNNNSGWLDKLRIAGDLLKLPSPERPRQTKRGPARLTGTRHSIQRDYQAVTYHYNVSNEFYGLWLDRRMVYSCAYFMSPDEDIDSAQERKLDLICRKLRLRPGQRMLDIGCGWGGLAIYAAKNYRVDVTGITLSQPQVELASERIAQAGLTDTCRVKLLDYRQMDEVEQFDALVSVGMFEHVGADLLPDYFCQANRMLKPGGVFLNHGIALGKLDDPETTTGATFSEAYVFPDGELVQIHQTLNAAESADFEVRDVESLREHYRLTLQQWVKRLEQAHTSALAFVDEATYRVWRLYMSGSAYGFNNGRLNVYQTLLVKSLQDGTSGLPLTRLDWYAQEQ